MIVSPLTEASAGADCSGGLTNHLSAGLAPLKSFALFDAAFIIKGCICDCEDEVPYTYQYHVILRSNRRFAHHEVGEEK